MSRRGADPDPDGGVSRWLVAFFLVVVGVAMYGTLVALGAV